MQPPGNTTNPLKQKYPPQYMDVAVIKATTSQFHVVPKEKHVRSKLLSSAAGYLCRTGEEKMADPGAALKEVVRNQNRQDVQYVIGELMKRLRSANDWLVPLCLFALARLLSSAGSEIHQNQDL